MQRDLINQQNVSFAKLQTQHAKILNKYSINLSNFQEKYYGDLTRPDEGPEQGVFGASFSPAQNALHPDSEGAQQNEPESAGEVNQAVSVLVLQPVHGQPLAKKGGNSKQEIHQHSVQRQGQNRQKAPSETQPLAIHI